MNKLSHLDSEGKIKMVDVSGKEITGRAASASSTIITGKKIFQAVKQNTISKGDVLSAAKVAGIQAAKSTSYLIPLCHNILLTHIDIQFSFRPKNNSIEIISTVKSNGQTGVEMEALTAVTVAALTVYDMCKAMSREIEITSIRLISKSGGKSGNYQSERSNGGR